MIQSLLGIGASVVGSTILSRLNTQEISVVHAMPGRIRLQSDEWKDEITVNYLKKDLITHPLVQSIQASIITGTILLTFKTATLTSEELNNMLQQMAKTTKDSYSVGQAKAMKSLQKLLAFVNGLVKKNTKGTLDIHSLIIFLFLGKGFSHMGKNKAIAIGFFFWAYRLLVNHKDKSL